MPRPQKRCKFIDDSAELSGEDVCDNENEEENNFDEPTKEDLDFVDEASQQSDEDSKISKANFVRPIFLACSSFFLLHLCLSRDLNLPSLKKIPSR